MKLRAWTDAVVPELGDVQNRAAPVREATIVAYDGGEQATAIVEGKVVRIDVRFLYMRQGAVEKAPAVEFKPAMRRSSSTAMESAYVRIKSSGQNSPDVITKRSSRSPRP